MEHTDGETQSTKQGSSPQTVIPRRPGLCPHEASVLVKKPDLQVTAQATGNVYPSLGEFCEGEVQTLRRRNTVGPDPRPEKAAILLRTCRSQGFTVAGDRLGPRDVGKE